MRDMTMLTKPQAPSSKLTQRKPSLGLEQELAARLQLLQALQTSLEPTQVIERFWQHCQNLVSISGLNFTSSDGENIQCGSKGAHQCHYQLKGDEGVLGDLTFSRSKRFAGDELASLEDLLSLVVFPLRNALHHQALARFSLRDALTGLGNRAALDTALQRELQLAQRHQHSLSLLMIDLDHFKQINDTHGHYRGDQILKSVAACIHHVCRSSDISFRYGGEEFVVLLRNTDSKGAQIIAERIRHQVAQLEPVPGVWPTVSIGIGTCLSGACDQMHQLFERADQALYRAKNLGRNRTQGE